MIVLNKIRNYEWTRKDDN